MSFSTTKRRLLRNTAWTQATTKELYRNKIPPKTVNFWNVNLKQSDQRMSKQDYDSDWSPGHISVSVEAPREQSLVCHSDLR